ncbi:MAG: AsmA-like C-terminal region-containing protein [Verrucomicrobia bacterium]|nr:AsmA-like C-terminal region-containing protein [Verrucomicrobiota bacterium]
MRLFRGKTGAQDRCCLRLSGLIRSLLFIPACIVSWLACNSYLRESFILPWLGKRINAELKAQKVRFNPFRGIVLERFSITPDSSVYPVFKAEKLRLEFKLSDILANRPYFGIVECIAPVVSVCRFEDGSTSMDFFRRVSQESTTPKTSKRKAEDAGTGKQHPNVREIRISGGKLNFHAEDMREANAVLSVYVDLTGCLNRERLALRRLTVCLGASDCGENVLNAQGRLDLSDLSAVGGDIAVHGTSVDAAVLERLYKRLFDSDKRKRPLTTDPEQTVQGDEQTQSARLPFSGLRIKSNIEKLIYSGEIISEAMVEATMNALDISIDSSACRIGSGVLRMNGRILHPGAIPRFECKLSTEAMELHPLLKMFGTATEFKGKVGAEADVSGFGTSLYSILNSISGKASFKLTETQVDLINPGIRRFLRPLMMLFRISELDKAYFTSVGGELSARNGLVTLHDVWAASRLFITSGSGVIDVSGMPGASSVMIPLQLRVERALAARLHIALKQETRSEAFVELPDFLGVTGTVFAPRLEVDMYAAGGALFRTLANHPIEFGRKAVSKFRNYYSGNRGNSVEGDDDNSKGADTH